MRHSISCAGPRVLWTCALAAIALLASLAISSTEAKAGPGGGCSDGNVCVFGATSYTGCYRDMDQDNGDYRNVPWQSCSSGDIQDSVSSLKNRGQCNVRMFADVGQTGAQITFSSPPGGTINDPYLTNGGGASGQTGDNWNDRISSHDFCV